MNDLIDGKVYMLTKYFFENKNRFNSITQRKPYYHMGATIVDTVLQAGMNYTYVVYPRVKELLAKYSDYKSTCDFIILFQTIPLKKLIRWNNKKKLDLITELSWFFYNNKIENENELSEWLNVEENILRLISINGIGPKSIDYLRMLSGKKAIPVDRHLFKFLEMANILVKSYEEASYIYEKAAQQLGLELYELDGKIWSYMAKV